MSSLRRCLVTGASGFFGQYVARVLASAGSDVTVYGRRAVAGYRFLQADLSAAAPAAVAGFDAVYHAAGLAHVVPRSEAERQAFYQVNREGTRRLLEAIDRGGERPETFLLVSTVAVYGVNEGVLLDEGTECRVADLYGESKRQAEDMLLEWASRRGVRSTVIRLPLVVGTGAPGNLRSMVEAIRRGRYRDVGGGRARRSMVMADDAAAILPRAAAAGGIFHLTDGVHPAFVDLSAALAETLGRGRVGNLPLWTARIAASAGDVVGRVTGRVMPINSRVLAKLTSTLTFSDERARSTLGWSPSPVLARVAELISEDQAPAQSRVATV
jgi:nucleoside-diphosphate-sugar epimerase